MLGVVTLYNPDREQAIRNIGSYAPDLDGLIVWDNSPINHSEWFNNPFYDYQWTGENRCIAPAINYALGFARKNGYNVLLLMDQDSQWTHFASYRQDIESRMEKGEICVFTPFVEGCDDFSITEEVQEKRLFINSGSVIPIQILQAIGGIDEQAFPLDAIDHDIAFSIREHGYRAVCLTSHRLVHSLGYPQRMGPFHLFTPNYNRFRTYHMTRSHIICYRKHHTLITEADRDYLFNEILRRKLLRIILAEPDKMGRLYAWCRGVLSGYRYKIVPDHLASSNEKTNTAN